MAAPVTTAPEAGPVITPPICPSDNRRPVSAQMAAVLDVLHSLPVGHIGLKTGEVVDRIGRRRDKAGFASVSRTLLRLSDAGAIEVFQSCFAQVGGGLFYRMNEEHKARWARPHGGPI